MERYMVYYDRGVIVCNKPTDMTCQQSYSTSVKVSHISPEHADLKLREVKLVYEIQHPLQRLVIAA